MMKSKVWIRRLITSAALALSLAVSACGGAAEAPTAVPAPAPTASRAAAPATAPADPMGLVPNIVPPTARGEIAAREVKGAGPSVLFTPPASCKPVRQTALENEVLQQINEIRTRAGKRPLIPNAKLTLAASTQAEYMACSSPGEAALKAHLGSNNSTLDQRSAAAGYGVLDVGENAAVGYPTTNEAVTGWMNSTSGHKENLLRAAWVETGIAVIVVPDGTTDPNGRETQYHRTWVQVFGDPTPHPPTPTSCTGQGNPTEETALLTAINTARTGKGLPALRQDPKLTAAARAAALAHVGCNGDPTTRIQDRLTTAGYAYKTGMAYDAPYTGPGFGTGGAEQAKLLLNQQKVLLQDVFSAAGVAYEYNAATKQSCWELVLAVPQP